QLAQRGGSGSEVAGVLQLGVDRELAVPTPGLEGRARGKNVEEPTGAIVARGRRAAIFARPRPVALALVVEEEAPAGRFEDLRPQGPRVEVRARQLRECRDPLRDGRLLALGRLVEGAGELPQLLALRRLEGHDLVEATADEHVGATTRVDRAVRGRD